MAIERIITVLDERQEIAKLEDGFYYYFPAGGGGIGAHDLRVIADELDKRNEQWANEIDAYFTEQKKKEGHDDGVDKNPFGTDENG